jgi:hypothetical protein
MCTGNRELVSRRYSLSSSNFFSLSLGWRLFFGLFFLAFRRSFVTSRFHVLSGLWFWLSTFAALARSNFVWPGLLRRAGGRLGSSLFWHHRRFPWLLSRPCGLRLNWSGCLGLDFRLSGRFGFSLFWHHRRFPWLLSRLRGLRLNRSGCLGLDFRLSGRFGFSLFRDHRRFPWLLSRLRGLRLNRSGCLGFDFRLFSRSFVFGLLDKRF